MIRQCYGPLLRRLLTDLRTGDVLLTGSGGTGKTQFQSVLFKFLVDKKVPVVLDLEDGKCFLIKDGTIKAGERGKSFITELNDRNTVYLYDARPIPGGDAQSTLPPLYVLAQVHIIVRLLKIVNRVR